MGCQERVLSSLRLMPLLCSIKNASLSQHVSSLFQFLLQIATAIAELTASGARIGHVACIQFTPVNIAVVR